MRIAVIGDHCLDIDYIGEYDGLMSREIEKLPVFNCHTVRHSGGGAANIVDALDGLGVNVLPVGAWGDIEGDILMSCWDNIDDTYMMLGQPTPAFIKHYQRSGQHIFRMNKKSIPLKEDVEENLIEAIGMLDVDAVIVADYDETGNGIVTPKIKGHILDMQGLKFATSRTDPGSMKDMDYVLMSEKEAVLSYVGYNGALNHSKLVVTLGASGSCIRQLKMGNSAYNYAKIPEDKQLTKNIDICGCGDSFLSAFVIKKLEGLPDLECLQWGNAAGRAQARKLYGAHTLTWDEIGIEYAELYAKTA